MPSEGLVPHSQISASCRITRELTRQIREQKFPVLAEISSVTATA